MDGWMDGWCCHGMKEGKIKKKERKKVFIIAEIT